MEGTQDVDTQVKIHKNGKATITSTKVKVKASGTKEQIAKLKVGKYPVDIGSCLDHIVEKEPLFSHLVRRLTIIESVKIKSSATDGINLFWNKDFFSMIPFKEQCGVLLHEVLHNAFLHLWRKGKREIELWNIACDYAINLVVNYTFPLPPGSLLDTQYIGMSAEEIYDKLPIEKKQQQGWCEKQSWNGQGSSQQGNQQPQGQGSSQGSNLSQEEQDKQKQEQQAQAKAASQSESQKERDWSDAFDQAFTQNYGNAPSYIQRAISKKHYIPVVNWAHLVSKILSEDVTDYTFARPDRRFLEAEYFLPDLYSWDKVKDVVFAYDTSGSISSNDLNAFYYETKELFKHFPTLTGWAAVCDARLHVFKEITAQANFKDIGFKGGGGTDFNPVFDTVKKKNLQPKAMFYFTDTYGYFPDKKPPYPVFWLIHSEIGDSYDYRVPFGKVIKFMNKSDIGR